MGRSRGPFVLEDSASFVIEGSANEDTGWPGTERGEVNSCSVYAVPPHTCSQGQF